MCVQIISPDVAIPGVAGLGVGVAMGGVSAPARRISDPVGGHSFPQFLNPTSLQLQEEILAMDGEYSVNYDTLGSIGKGAFGFVRLAQRKEDGMRVSILKAQGCSTSIITQCMSDSQKWLSSG